MALYRAKEDERGPIVSSNPAMDARAQAQRLLEIDAALTRNEFEVHYRPIHDLKTDQIIAFEALIRWNRIIRCEEA